MAQLQSTTVTNLTLTESVGTASTPQYVLTLSDAGVIQKTAFMPPSATGSNNYIAKFSGTNSLGNSQIFDNGTFVGINTNLPNSLLDVLDTATSTSNSSARITNRSSAASLPTRKIFELAGIYNNGSNGHQLFINSTDSSGWDFNFTKTWGGYMSFGVSIDGTQITRHMAITSAGDVGIGTVAPNGKLEVRGNLRTNGGDLFLADTLSTTAFRISSYGGANSLWFLASNTKLVLADSVDWDRSMSIEYVPGSTGALAGRLSIGQINKNSATWTHGITSLFTNGTERLRLTAAGDLLLGTTTVDPFSRNDEKRVTFVSTDVSGSANFALSLVAGATASRGAQIYMGVGTTRHLTISSNSTETTIGVASATPLIFGTNNTNWMRITSAGNVGIGTATPSFRLDVDSGTGANSFRALSTNTTSNRFFLEATSGNVEQHFLYTGNQDWVLGLDKADSNKFKLASADDAFASAKVTVTTAGNVGIGTTSPGALLHVNGTALFAANSGTIQIAAASPFYTGANISTGANNFGIGTTGAALLGLWTNNLERIRITSAGNVGIGTATPSFTLDVSSNPTFVSTGNIGTNVSHTIGTIGAGSSFTAGSVWAGVSSYINYPFGGSSTVPNTVNLSGVISVNRIGFTSAGTITMTPSSGSNIRSIAAMTAFMHTDAASTGGVVSHVSSLYIPGVYPMPGSNPVTFTNYYALLINSIGEHGYASATNKWAIYQDGSTDANYFAGNVSLGTTASSARLTVAGSVAISGGIVDSAGSSGVDGYVLSKATGGVLWQPSSVLQGTQGVQGTTGNTGVQGIQGTTGTTGNTGAQGTQGTTGNTGNTGAQGTQGTTGNTGNTGAQGTQGTTGNTGAQGTTGNTGNTGAQGTTGNTGNTGAQGTQGTIGNTGGTGAQGTQGTTGNTGGTGAQGTQGTTGNTGGTGAQGTQGTTGSTGGTGNQGTQGTAGSTGGTGTQGTQGTAGSTGGTGTQGTQGTTGTGTQGTQGTTGTGTQGTQGTTGTGTQGTQGTTGTGTQGTQGTNAGITSYTGSGSNRVITSVSSSQIEGEVNFQFDASNNRAWVNGHLVVGNITPSSSTAGRIEASDDIVAFSTSDERLKTNFVLIDNALEKLKQLSGYNFVWRQDRVDIHGYEGSDIGIIAQEVQNIIPEAVRQNESGYLAVRYEKLIPLIIQALKELERKLI